MLFVGSSQLDSTRCVNMYVLNLCSFGARDARVGRTECVNIRKKKKYNKRDVTIKQQYH